MTDETLLTPEEVAERLKVKPWTVREWLRVGKLKGVRLAGRTWRVRPSQLDAFLRAGEEPPADEDASAIRPEEERADAGGDAAL